MVVVAVVVTVVEGASVVTVVGADVGAGVDGGCDDEAHAPVNTKSAARSDRIRRHNKHPR